MAYERVNWENLPSTKTPINQTNLNKMENGIDQAGAEIFVGAEEPTAGEKVWFNKDKNSIYVRNSNGVYEEFTKKSEEVYSTEEQRIGTWIDGKPLYRKVIDFGALPSSPLYKYVNHNIQNISQIVFLDGFCIDSSSEWAFPVNCIRPNTANSNIGCYASKTQIVIECGVNRSSYRAYITLEYTKTTD